MHSSVSLTAALVSTLSITSLASGRLVGIPTVPFNMSSGSGLLSIQNVTAIVVDTQFSHTTDTNGTTLIPPSLQQFATTFAADLQSYLGQDVNVLSDSQNQIGQIFLTLGQPSDFVDAAGRPTSEGYKLTVTGEGITITGSSPLGTWWGTRTILQQAALGNGSIPFGSAVDSPGWGIRGVMLDAGRHYYPPGFIIEICSYLSFFKQNTFHLHLSDNLIFSASSYTAQQSLELYAAFRLKSDDSAVAGLDTRANESYTKSDFENIQKSCASRGVTIVPELEMPGHALVISQWKPEIGLSNDLSLLNLSHPETAPTCTAIWKAFLPWLYSKTVHIGADEYSDPQLSGVDLADSYNQFVNAMNTFITGTSGQSVRIWGTYPPSSTYSQNINQSVSIQHWSFYEDNPYLQYVKNGYNVLNSGDTFYIVNKYSGSYPQTLNLDTIFSGGPGDAPFAPYIFDTFDASNNPPRNNPNVLGHIAALWNDDGPNATVYSEAYYAWRDGLPALADKQWGGDLVMSEYNYIFNSLHAAIPAQNLDRSIRSESNLILQYLTFSTGGTVSDTSGNGYDGQTNCTSSDSAALLLAPNCALTTPLTSKGRNYTLSFSIYPTGSNPGPLFTGPDSALLAGNGSITNLMLVASGNPYILDYSLPANQWTNGRLIGRGPQTLFDPGNGTEIEFRALLRTPGNTLVSAPIAIEAPLASIGGGAVEGLITNIQLLNSAMGSSSRINASPIIHAADYTSNNGTQTQQTSDIGGGENVGWIHDGEWLAYRGIDFSSTGYTSWISRVSSGVSNSASGRVNLVLDNIEATPISSFSISNTGGWQNWINITTPIKTVSGLHTVYLTFSSDQSADFVNINWFAFS